MGAPVEWLWLCRPGYERDLLDELAATKSAGAAERVAAGLVRSQKRPRAGGDAVELAFARQGLPVEARIETGPEPGPLAQAAARLLAPRLGGSFALHVFVPDSDEANPLAPYAAQVEAALLAALPDGSQARRVEAHEAPEGSTPLAQLLVTARGRGALGVVPVAQAPSLAPGGRRRIGAPPGAPSRAAAKLLEAFDWLGRAPDPGDLCIDLGAAPGGWSHVLLQRRARVLAIDPARLAPQVARHKNLRHLQRSAFEFLPDEPADWLLCDMAWRPLEVAALLAKWGRRGAARFLIANIKLPMKKKVEMLGRVREILATGGWKNVRVRQLYHDRDEVTIGAWRLG
jgi:23S rRNA (cytidine2498-2'-O)-methyltransferase